jgi:hypothetical protein
MKPFDLEAALRGEKVVTRDGREVTQLVRFKGTHKSQELFGVVKGSEVPHSWYSDGIHLAFINPSDNDLFMHEEPEEQWAPTMELRRQIRGVPVGANIVQNKIYLQQKWITGGGTANEPFKVKWVDVPTVKEEEQ